MKSLLTLLSLLLLQVTAFPQTRFAFVTDTHIGGDRADEDLRRTVRDINSDGSLSFVILSGDITEFGSDSELSLARSILDSLRMPWYIVPGNHDTKWSESGGNSFRKIFGAEAFAFRQDGYLFIGTNSGPNMRMGPGQIPRENIVWLDSVLADPANRDLKIISVNHYPLDPALNNWFELTDRLRMMDARLALCGHGHANRELTFEGIPALMCRSNLRARDSVGGYNIITLSGDTLLTAAVRQPGVATLEPWATVRLHPFTAEDDTTKLVRPDYSVNDSFPEVKEVWRVQENSDIGSGMALTGNTVIITNTAGEVRALEMTGGKELWKFTCKAKIYSTPVIAGSTVIASATDGMVYAIDLVKGSERWRFDTGQPIVSSPVVTGDCIFIAGSSGRCYSLELKNGRVVWSNSSIDGFPETIPLVYGGMIIFGTWNNHLYALDQATGEIKWDWQNGYANRMLSPAACVPVATGGKVFVVAPDRKMACLDAATGKVLWNESPDGSTVRESMGMSSDSSLVYAKTMDGTLIGVPSDGLSRHVAWKAAASTGYDIAPAVITEQSGVVFIPTDKGIIHAVTRSDGRLLWIHRISSCLVNQVLPAGDNRLLCSTMDGTVTLLSFPRY